MGVELQHFLVVIRISLFYLFVFATENQPEAAQYLHQVVDKAFKDAKTAVQSCLKTQTGKDFLTGLHQEEKPAEAAYVFPAATLLQ